MKSARIHMLLGLAVSAIALGAAVHKVDWSRFAASLMRVNGWWIAAALLLTSINLVIRAARWRDLVASCAPIRPGLGESFRFYMIGYMANMVFPLKAGEIIRPYLLGRKHAQSVSALLATVIIERLADILCLGVLLALVFLIGITQIPLEVWQGLAILVTLAALGFSGLSGMARRPDWLVGLPGRLTFLPAGLRERGGAVLGHFLRGFRSMVGWGAMARLVLWTTALWAVAFFTLEAYLKAFGFSLPWYAPAFIIVITNFGMMLPSSPGAIGLAHYLYVFALSRFIVEKSEALTFAVLVHGIGFLIVVLLGLLSAWAEGISFREMQNHSAGICEV